mgnify:FL=1
MQIDGTLHLRMWVPFFVVCSGTTHQNILEVLLWQEEEVKKLQKRYQKEKEQIHDRFVAEGKVGYGA